MPSNPVPGAASYYLRNIPGPLYRKLQRKARREGTNVRAVLLSAITAYVQG